ncbi:MAG: phosphotransferase enzyme family protein [Hyphomicrobiales bacterium]
MAGLVQRSYSLERIPRCDLYARGVNDTYRIDTSDGAFYLRVYRFGWRSRAEIEAELEMLIHLARRQAPVCRPIAQSDGSLVSLLDCPEGERHAVLFSAAPGAVVDYKDFTERQAYLYGRASAAIHQAADSYQGSRERPAFDLTTLVDEPFSLVSSALSHRLADRDFLDKVGQRLRSRVEAADGLTLGFCHGDFHGGNANLSDESFTFYDFDCCGWGYRAYDIAIFPWAFALTGAEPSRIDRMGRSFLSGYSSRQALACEDVVAIPEFVSIRQVWLMGLQIGLAERFGSGWLTDRYFDRQLQVLRDWEATYVRRPIEEWLSVVSGDGSDTAN